MSSLYVIRGKDQGHRFEIDRDISSIGREPTCDISLNDTEISRRHAEIHFRDGNHVVVDLQSSNGTFVNSNSVNEHTLRTGDRVQFGRSVLLFTENRRDTKANVQHGVNIVSDPQKVAESRIVSSISQLEGSRFFADPSSVETPWLDNARSNLQIMYRTALAISHTLDIDQLLDRILEMIFDWVETDRGCVMLLDQNTNELEVKATRHRNEHAEKNEIEISRTILDYVMQGEEGVRTSDAQDDGRWDPGASIVKMGVREAICVPLQGRYGIVGVIYIDTYSPAGDAIAGSGNKFSDEHLKLMVAIGHQAALAVEDTFYYVGMVQSERLAAIGQTIATLSHHIKNILQGIRGGSYLIEEGLKGSDHEVVGQGWKIVEKNQERISNLVLDMLSFSKERKPILVPANLNQVVEDVVELMKSRAEEIGVTLHWEPDPSLPDCRFDQDGIHRALLNVVSNAIDACQNIEEARVEVSVLLDPQTKLAKIAVQDNGEGIAPDDLKKIFSIFESRKGSRGTGLGLPVSEKIMREHGGRIEVISSPQEGSRFELILPIIEGEKSNATITDLPAS